MEKFFGKVRDLSSQGLGVVDHPEGRVYFVRGTWPGDVGEFEIETQEKKYGFAKIIKLTELSPDRIENPCKHSGNEEGKCGGCPWLGIDYEKQLLQKQKGILYQLERTGAFEKGHTKIFNIQPSPQLLGYRNRAQFKTDGKQIGFVSTRSKTLAPIEDCLSLNKKTRDILAYAQGLLPNSVWSPKEKYLWSYLEIDSDMEITDLVPNKKRPFKQANDEQNKFMQTWLKQKLTHQSKESPVLELFCGSGNFTKIISQLGFKKIIATEVDQKAVDTLQAQGFNGVTPIACDIFYSKNWKLIYEKAKDTEILVLDPPRGGFEKIVDFCDRLKKLKNIYYISCDPNSFATEARFLKKEDWLLSEVQPLDQFPQTPHVELMAIFEKTI